jgi:Ca2+-binding EF-hand superfamily protein
MRISGKTLCAVGLLLTWTGMCAASQDAGHICFQSIDANQDGVATFEEFAAHYGKDEKQFNACDTNGDGRLTHDEYHDFLGHGASDKSDEK